MSRTSDWRCSSAFILLFITNSLSLNGAAGLEGLEPDPRNQNHPGPLIRDGAFELGSSSLERLLVAKASSSSCCPSSSSSSCCSSSSSCSF